MLAWTVADEWPHLEGHFKYPSAQGNGVVSEFRAVLTEVGPGLTVKIIAHQHEDFAVTHWKIAHDLAYAFANGLGLLQQSSWMDLVSILQTHPNLIAHAQTLNTLFKRHQRQPSYLEVIQRVHTGRS